MTKKITNYEYDVTTQDGKQSKETLADVIGNLLLLSAQTDGLKGIDQFKQYNNFFKIIREAKNTGFIELENKDHNYLKDLIIKEIPPIWGANNNIYKVIENFLNA